MICGEINAIWHFQFDLINNILPFANVCIIIIVFHTSTVPLLTLSGCLNITGCGTYQSIHQSIRTI